MPLADAVNGGVGRLDVVIALQVPDDANRPHVVCPTQVKDFLDDVIGCLVRVVVRTAPAARESGFAELAVPVSPEVEGRR
jgi:hypothetical protein